IERENDGVVNAKPKRTGAPFGHALGGLSLVLDRELGEPAALLFRPGQRCVAALRATVDHHLRERVCRAAVRNDRERGPLDRAPHYPDGHGEQVDPSPVTGLEVPVAVPIVNRLTVAEGW